MAKGKQSAVAGKAMCPKLAEINTSDASIHQKLDHLIHDCHIIEQWITQNPKGTFSSGWVNYLTKNVLAVASEAKSQTPQWSMATRLDQMDEVLREMRDQQTKDADKLLQSIRERQPGANTVNPSQYMTSGYRRCVSWNEGIEEPTHVSRTLSTPTDSSISAPAPKVEVEDLRLRVRVPISDVAQTLRSRSAEELCNMVNKAVEDSHNPSLNAIMVRAALQLKSGDVELYTSTVGEVERLTHSQTSWVGIFGKGAYILESTFAVILHGIATNTVDGKDEETLKALLLAQNAIHFPTANIAYVGWLSQAKAERKTKSSLVVAFTEEEYAWVALTLGMIWKNRPVHTEPYEPNSQMMQCKRCQQYGHKQARCRSPLRCARCAESHETETCPGKGSPGEKLKCALCNGPHTSFSEICPQRRARGHELKRRKARGPDWYRKGIEEGKAIQTKERLIKTNKHGASPPNANVNRQGSVCPEINNTPVQDAPLQITTSTSDSQVFQPSVSFTFTPPDAEHTSPPTSRSPLPNTSTSKAAKTKSLPPITLTPNPQDAPPRATTSLGGGTKPARKERRQALTDITSQFTTKQLFADTSRAKPRPLGSPEPEPTKSKPKRKSTDQTSARGSTASTDEGNQPRSLRSRKRKAEEEASLTNDPPTRKRRPTEKGAAFQDEQIVKEVKRANGRRITNRIKKRMGQMEGTIPETKTFTSLHAAQYVAGRHPTDFMCDSTSTPDNTSITSSSNAIGTEDTEDLISSGDEEDKNSVSSEVAERIRDKVFAKQATVRELGWWKKRIASGRS